MNVRDRYLAAYRHQPVDRVPIALSYFHAGFTRRHPPLARPTDDPIEVSIGQQLRYGFDPHAYVRGTADWFLAHPYPGEAPEGWETASKEWQLQESRVTEPGGNIRTHYRIDTPQGPLTCVRLQTPDDFGLIVEPFLKEEQDIERLRYRPHPRYTVNPALIRRSMATMGDRCWAMASIIGVWGLASFLRGPETIMYDCFERPGWVKRLMGVLGDYQVELVREIGQASDGLVLRLDGSFVGFGIGPKLFREFIEPDDRRIVRAAHDTGMMVHMHVCGKKNVLLEALAGMDIDALETLTPPEASGDVLLGDAKRRIGRSVCLMGGALSHILTFGTIEDVQREVQRCLREGAPGGGYILSPSGRVDPETPEENLIAFTEAGRAWGV